MFNHAIAREWLCRGLSVGVVSVSYWIHIARSIDRVTLHKDRCSEVPSTSIVPQAISGKVGGSITRIRRER